MTKDLRLNIRSLPNNNSIGIESEALLYDARIAHAIEANIAPNILMQSNIFGEEQMPYYLMIAFNGNIGLKIRNRRAFWFNRPIF